MQLITNSKKKVTAEVTNTKTPNLKFSNSDVSSLEQNLTSEEGAIIAFNFVFS